MARIRSIRPEFWSDEKIVECSAWARLLFIGLWNFADDHGRMEYSATRLKLQIFPADQLEIEPLIQELRGRTMVLLYTVDNRHYLQITNFSKHQKVDHPGQSRCPAPPDNSRGLANPRESSRVLAPEKEKEREREKEKEPEKEKVKSAVTPPASPARASFQKPTLEQVKSYCQERQNHVNPNVWFDHYIANGWKVGRSPMRDWRAAVRTWEQNGMNRAPSSRNGRGRKDTTDEQMSALAATVAREYGEAD